MTGLANAINSEINRFLTQVRLFCVKKPYCTGSV